MKRLPYHGSLVLTWLILLFYQLGVLCFQLRDLPVHRIDAIDDPVQKPFVVIIGVCSESTQFF
jgi:hypothetical protein